MDPAGFKVFSNYVAMPASEAFGIEYWLMEEAKIRRQPPEKELSRAIALIVGGASGIGREVALLAAARGAHVWSPTGMRSAAALVAEEGCRNHVEGIRGLRLEWTFAIARQSAMLSRQRWRLSAASTC